MPYAYKYHLSVFIAQVAIASVAGAQVQYQFQDTPRPEADVMVARYVLQIRGTEMWLVGRVFNRGLKPARNVRINPNLTGKHGTRPAGYDDLFKSVRRSADELRRLRGPRRFVCRSGYFRAADGGVESMRPIRVVALAAALALIPTAAHPKIRSAHPVTRPARKEKPPTYAVCRQSEFLEMSVLRCAFMVSIFTGATLVGASARTLNRRKNLVA